MNSIDPNLVKECKDTRDCNVGFHQPGYAAGFGKFSDQKEKGCGDMVSRLWGDNPQIRASSFNEKCPMGTSKIALIVDPERDYHFLREDPDGYWSHKPGALPVKRTDASDRPIIRPDRALFLYKESKDPLMYTDFCGYFCVPRGKPLHMSKISRGGARRAIGDELSSLVSIPGQKGVRRYFLTRRKRSQKK
jgi:hypothetical protein